VSSDADPPDSMSLDEKREALIRLARELRAKGTDPMAELRAADDPPGHDLERAIESVPAQAVLDAIPASLAVLDSDGRIVSTNLAWRRFGEANGAGCAPKPAATDYFAVCERAASAGCDYAARAAEGLKAVLGGREPAFSMEYPCHSRSEQRWFRLIVARLEGPDDGAVTLHLDVSERHLAEEALRASEVNYRALFDSHPQPMWVFDTGTLRYLAVNETAVKVYGYSREEFLSMRVGDIRPAEDLPRLQENLARGGQDLNAGVWRHRLRDGRIIHVAISSSELAFGGRRARLVQALDVSDQIAAQEALAASERHLRAIHDSEPECVKTVSPDGVLLSMNPAGLAMIQAAHCPELVLGRKVDDLVHPQDRPAFQALHRRVCTGGTGELQFRIIGLQGRQLWMETRSVPLLDTYGTVVAVLSITRDITEKRQTEARLRLLEAAIERINDIVMVAEVPASPQDELTILYANQALYRISGYRPEEVLGRTPDFLHGPETSPSEVARIRAALHQGRPVRAELASYSKDGSQYWVELDAVVIEDEQGRSTHIVSIERNVTERRKLEAKLRQAQRMEAIGHLTGGMAHDFNNLLTVIQGNAELLVESLQTQPRLQALARRVDEASQRGAKLTHRLLAFARRQPLQATAIALPEMLNSFRALLLRTLGEKVRFELDCPPDIPAAMADAGELEAALLNLCLNARDAMPRGGDLRIEARALSSPGTAEDAAAALAPGNYVVLTVSDTGVGIAPEVLPRVFEPFFTTKADDGGNGLGLPMVYGFARQSGGHVAIESAPGEGTSVRLYLPSGEAAAASAAASSPVPALVSATVLLVEDDPDVRNFAGAQLKSLGFTVIEAENGARALEHLASTPSIDLLFTDVVMPGGINGAELAEKALSLRPGLPVVFTSGYTQDALSLDGHLPEGTLLLRKPYRRADLSRVLVQALQHAGRGQ